MCRSSPWFWKRSSLLLPYSTPPTYAPASFLSLLDFLCTWNQIWDQHPAAELWLLWHCAICEKLVVNPSLTALCGPTALPTLNSRSLTHKHAHIYSRCTCKHMQSWINILPSLLNENINGSVSQLELFAVGLQPELIIYSNIHRLHISLVIFEGKDTEQACRHKMGHDLWMSKLDLLCIS